MRTGLTKRQKTTGIFFDEQSNIIEVQTHNTDLKKRLGAFAQQYPSLCRQTDDGGARPARGRRNGEYRLKSEHSSG